MDERRRADQVAMIAQAALQEASVTAQVTSDPTDRVMEKSIARNTNRSTNRSPLPNTDRMQNTERSNVEFKKAAQIEKEATVKVSAELKIEQATVELKKKNLVMEAMERDLRERVEQNSIRYNPPKLLEKPKTPELKAPVPTTGVKVDMSVTPVRQKMEKKIGEIVKEKNKTMKK